MDCARPTVRVAVSAAILVLGSVCVAPSLAGQTVETYDTAVVDTAGQLHVFTTDHRDIVPVKDSDQVGFDQPAVAPDRGAVGWLALYPNCCTSYPIPLKLVVRLKGQAHTFTGVELPVWRWRFDETGKRVSFHQETVHGGTGSHYELRDIASGRLIEQYEPADSTPPPAWVKALESDSRAR